MSQQQQFQRLKVEDALSYLDKVKLQFSVQPHVYNDFLDIMKEFKSQSIDTPGVITRVSNLFKGHPDLIVGFNTFLPPGYKIEMNANDMISVHQPGQKVISLYAPSAARASQHLSEANAQSVAMANFDPPQITLRQPGVVGYTRIVDLVREVNGGDSNQPVEFSHAISYVNKIKSRYASHPDVYKAFLDILHTYQKEQRDLSREVNEGIISGVKRLSETEVFSKVAVLFKNQPDLLSEFGQFLPDANGSGSAFMGGISFSDQSSSSQGAGVSGSGTSSSVSRKVSSSSYVKPSPPVVRTVQRRRLSSVTSSAVVAPKKLKTDTVPTTMEVSIAEAGKFGSLGDFAFFDKVHKVLGDKSYTDFLKCLHLYNQRVFGISDLLLMIHSFSPKMPDLLQRVKELLQQKNELIEVPMMTQSKERIQGQFAHEIDYSMCRRLGVSYRGLPVTYIQPKCSGRTPLCWEVLNDTLVSFPSWSEDSSSVIKKTMAEEQIFRCEDERYQLDIVLDNIKSTTLVLEVVQDKLNSMTPEDQTKFRLDNTLGGSSEALHRKTIQRLYKERATEVIEGLKRNPALVVPMVLKRLYAKQQQWVDAKQNLEKVWNEQNQKYYLKSLDHQGINFKQTDTKQLRSKALLLEIENALEERQEQLTSQDPPAPLLTFAYCKRHFIEDTSSLIIHHVKRQTSIHQDEKQKIKVILHRFIPELFFLPHGDLGDIEPYKDPDAEETSGAGGNADYDTMGVSTAPACHISEDDVTQQPNNGNGGGSEVDSKPVKSSTSIQEEEDWEAIVDDGRYSLLYGNNNWYLFFRLHYILYERLVHFHHHSQLILEEELRSRQEAVESTAIALGLKAQRSVKAECYYPVFLDMVRNYLDGNVETATYEEQLREMYGIHAYLAFTIDKLIQNIVRQLQHLVVDSVCTQITELHTSERCALEASELRTTMRQTAEQSYQKKCEQLLGDENCFKIVLYKHRRKLALDLLDPSESQSEERNEEQEQWTDYVKQFVSTENPRYYFLKDHLINNPVILTRNIRRGKLANKRMTEMKFMGNKEAESSDSPSTSKPVTAIGAVDISGALEGRTAEVGSGGVTEGAGSEGGSTGVVGSGEGARLCMMDNVECKFSVNSFKMLYVENSSMVQYKPGALTRARQTHRDVSLRKHAKLLKWTGAWLKRNVTADEAAACRDWFLGHIDGLVKCITTKKEIKDISRKPYYVHYHYSCTR